MRSENRMRIERSDVKRRRRKIEEERETSRKLGREERVGLDREKEKSHSIECKRKLDLQFLRKKNM